jgi:prepilin-type N-terminal cleavage/methylation domain-containing protein
VTNLDGTKTICREKLQSVVSNSGFTLLEIMIALLLLAIITTTSVSMLFLNIKGWESVSERSNEQIAGYLVATRVEHMIRNLSPLIWQQRKARQLAFSGDARHIQFIAPAPQQYQPGGLFEYRLTQENDPQSGQSLVLYYAPYYTHIKQFSLPEQGHRRILMSGLESVNFSFYGKQQNRFEVLWSDQWAQTDRYYPELIKISWVEQGASVSQEGIVRIRKHDSRSY